MPDPVLRHERGGEGGGEEDIPLRGEQAEGEEPWGGKFVLPGVEGYQGGGARGGGEQGSP